MHEDTMPTKYTCDGSNDSPPLTFADVPATAKSLVLVMDDPDAPGGTFTHWTVYDMAVDTQQLPENEMPATGLPGLNDFSNIGYGGPCTPQGSAAHRYYFRLYALEDITDLPPGAERADLEAAMADIVILDKATLLAYCARE